VLTIVKSEDKYVEEGETMRKIILNLAISLDGYISDDKGGFDWIVGHGDKSQDIESEFTFESFLETVDTLVMGSKAYEDCIISGLSDFGDRKIVVATSRCFESREHVEFVSGDVVKIIEDLKDQEGKDIYLFGGAKLTDAFIRANAVDQYVIGFIPTILGQGRRLFKGDYAKIDLHLDDISVTDGIAIMIYSKRR